MANFIYRDMGPLKREGGNLTLLQKPLALASVFFMLADQFIRIAVTFVLGIGS